VPEQRTVPQGVTFVAVLPAIPLIFTRATRRRPEHRHHLNTYFTVARVYELTT